MDSDSNKRVLYCYTPTIAAYKYNDQGHIMKPFRIGMVNCLVSAMGLDRHMTLLRPASLSAAELGKFHSESYLERLQHLKPDEEVSVTDIETFGLGGTDNPAFKGIFDFSALAAGASVACAVELNLGNSDIVLNWAGGLHHARKGKAAGFCPANDIVLGTTELMKRHGRVLYVDIDVHHGDGVENAFYGTNRVATVSFHKYGEKFFPETGSLNDIGAGIGLNYAINVPLNDGITDDSFFDLFKKIVDPLMLRFQPNAIVMQCGADSLAGDLVGPFNLSTVGHGRCVDHIKRKNLPLMLLGGGGYNLANVGRCFANATAIANGKESPENVPWHSFWEHYSSHGYKFHTQPEPDMDNENSDDYLAAVINSTLQRIQKIEIAPSVQLMEREDQAMEVDDEEETTDNRDEMLSNHNKVYSSPKAS